MWYLIKVDLTYMWTFSRIMEKEEFQMEITFIEIEYRTKN